MKYSKIIKAMPALAEIRKLRLPYAKARKIYEIAKKITEEYEFFTEEEAKLINEYAKPNENGTMVSDTGVIAFASVEDKKAYTEKINELAEQQSNIEIDVVALLSGEVGAQQITTEAIINLEGIIEFK